MKITTMYNYLGTNGTICSPVHLEDIYFTRSLKLEAPSGKKLTKDDGKTLYESVIIPEDELELWKEVKA